MRPDHVLERNLELLLRRAYVAQVPRESFRRALAADVRARVASMGRQDAPAPRGVVLPFARRVAVAAAVVLVGLVAFRFARDAAPPGVDALLARSEVAVRRAPDGTWSAAPGGGVRDGAAFLEVRTPQELGASVELEGAGAELVATLRVEAGSSAAVRREDGRPVAHLAEGALTAETADALTVRSRAGAIRVERGSARIAHEPPADPRADVEADWVRLVVRSGRALLSDHAAEPPVEAGEEVFLRPGHVLRPGGGPDVAAAERPGDVRTALGTGEPPLDAATDSVTGAEPPADEPPAWIRVSARAGDADDAEPVTAYELVLLREVQLPQVESPTVVRVTVADLGPDGAYGVPPSLFGRGPGRYSVHLRAPGFALWSEFSIDVGPDRPARVIDARLTRGGTVRGIVVDEDGLPIADAVVVSQTDVVMSLLPLAFEDEDVPLSFFVHDVTGPDGGFEIEHLTAGTQILRATLPKLAADWSAPLELREGEVVGGVELELGEPGGIAGRVTDAEGEPRAGVTLIASHSDFDMLRPVLTYRLGETDAEGRYRIEGLPPGQFVVLNFGEAVEAAESVQPDMVFANVHAGETTTVDFVTQPLRPRFEGVLLDSAGEPVAGRSIWVGMNEVPAPLPESTESWTSTTTGPDGSFRFTNLGPGRYEVFVSGRTPPEMIRVGGVELPPTGSVQREVRLTAGRLAGRIVDGLTDEPVARCVVVVLQVNPDGVRCFAGKVFSGEDGRFEAAGLPDGLYALVAFSTDGRYGHESDGPFAVGAAASVDELEFRLLPGGGFEFQVSDGLGAPVPFATVSLWDDRGEPIQVSDDPRADRFGRRRYAGLRPGRWSYRVTAEGHGAVEGTFDVEAGRETTVPVTLPGE